jgi:hypothetical protein
MDSFAKHIDAKHSNAMSTLSQYLHRVYQDFDSKQNSNNKETQSHVGNISIFGKMIEVCDLALSTQGETNHEAGSSAEKCN